MSKPRFGAAEILFRAWPGPPPVARHGIVPREATASGSGKCPGPCTDPGSKDVHRESKCRGNRGSVDVEFSRRCGRKMRTALLFLLSSPGLFGQFASFSLSACLFAAARPWHSPGLAALVQVPRPALRHKRAQLEPWLLADRRSAILSESYPQAPVDPREERKGLGWTEHRSSRALRKQ